ncbi:cyclic GMP-AMP synthase-like isoform X1 [Erpetoichthys calabaricus]|uniref:cyclic GMP-AMP synthase-like isoform X1 n=1 Tax=Erpetoichthys calabaricus TaxID=27687 RepID=UPI0010A07515|nr:cyclic GMP-AMP synthase-like isoform X1 [Erpetoichthys calabaricus]XP_051774983.1 cyclic GMP-AMP synthase-like isoform X1 [Erpetoichthys calabaricus]XP_051774984.1 cyclic GMP-AMP synthase-like isoform X1 [Erpetoichthys calabaricus]
MENVHWIAAIPLLAAGAVAAIAAGVTAAVRQRDSNETPTLHMLKKLYQDKVDFSKRELDPYKSKAEDVVTTILKLIQKHVRQGDPKINEEPIGTGSGFEGVKVKPEVEFDFMVPIQVRFRQIIVSDDDHNVPACFGLIQIEESGRIQFQSATVWGRDTSDFKEKFCIRFGSHGYVLSAGKIQRWFQSMCARTLLELAKHFPGYNFRFRTSGPARTLVFDWLGKEVNIDLVPAVQYEDAYLVAKMTSRLGEAAWRFSFSTHEKAFFQSLSPNYCYFKCLKILKYLRENDKKMCPTSHLSSSCPSYYLKTAFLYQAWRSDQDIWKNEDLEDRVKNLLRYLAECMRQRHLQHIYKDNTNLLKEVSSTTLEQIRLRLLYIHNNFDSVLQYHLQY